MILLRINFPLFLRSPSPSLSLSLTLSPSRHEHPPWLTIAAPPSRRRRRRRAAFRKLPLLELVFIFRSPRPILYHLAVRAHFRRNSVVTRGFIPARFNGYVGYFDRCIRGARNRGSNGERLVHTRGVREARLLTRPYNSVTPAFT